MKLTRMLLVALIVLTVGNAQAADYGKSKDLDISGDDKALAVALDLTYKSQYMSWGKQGFGNKSGIFAHTIVDFWDSGFGIKVGYQGANSSGYVESQRYNYNIFYNGSLFSDTAYYTKYTANWRYEHYYGQKRNAKNAQEWTLSCSWPELLGVENLSPYYIFDYEHAAGSNYGNSRRADFIHVFGLAYKLNTQELPNPLKLTTDITYCDGFYEDGGKEIHDWSHITFGASTKFKISDSLAFTPGIYHQLSMDDGVCEKDITYCSLNLRYTF